MRNILQSTATGLALTAVLILANSAAQASAREEGRLLTATEVLEEIQDRKSVV